jgi:hypothetical protein
MTDSGGTIISLEKARVIKPSLLIFFSFTDGGIGFLGGFLGSAAAKSKPSILGNRKPGSNSIGSTSSSSSVISISILIV